MRTWLKSAGVAGPVRVMVLLLLAIEMVLGRFDEVDKRICSLLCCGLVRVMERLWITLLSSNTDTNSPD